MNCNESKPAITGRQPGATECSHRPPVGALCLLGLALLAGAVGAAGPDPQETTGAVGKPIGSTIDPYVLDERPRTTLWCGHDLHTVVERELTAERRAIWTGARDYAREDGGAAHLRNLGDFNGDGKDDVLLRHQDGRWHYYQMGGRHVLSSSAVDLPRDLAWQVAGIGDFNGDGNDDVLLRHPDRDWHYYAMDGGRVLADSGRVSLPVTAGTDEYGRLWNSTFRWQVAVGDFDGDGRDDMLLRYTDTSGSWPWNDRWHYYRLDGRRVLSGSGRAKLTRDPTWRIAGIADLNHDGKDDVLLRKTDGRWYFYPMDGRRVLDVLDSVLFARGTVRMTRDLAWQMVGIGRFDVDVRKSVLLRHQDGRWRYYRVLGRQVVGSPVTVDITDDTSETVAGIGDLNGDGQTDVLARRADGSWYYYAMYDGRVASFGTGLPGTPALSEDLAWGALSCYNLATGTTLPGRTFIDHRDETVSLSFLSRAAFVDDQTLTYQVRSSNPDVVRASVTGSALTLMPVAEGTATVTGTVRDPDGNSATQAFAVRYARETFQDCRACPEMVIIPAGTFTMGSPESEVWRHVSEGPQRTVSIPAFAVSAHEVTFAQWDECAASWAPLRPPGPFTLVAEELRLRSHGGCVRYVGVGQGGSRWPGFDAYYPDDAGWGRDNRPVINVNWEHAQLYVAWLSRRFGQPYRLLTESEWEYAARAGTTTPFHTGETITPLEANFDGRCSYPDDYLPDGWCRSRGLFRGETVPVGSFRPNRFGLYDMHGNAIEWVQDCPGSYSTAPSDGSAAAGADCNHRSQRGGHWKMEPPFIRSAFRGNSSDAYTEGFRVARTL